MIPDVPAWAAWLVAAAFFSVGELLTPGLFFLGPVALAAVAAALTASVAGGAAALLVFILGSVLSLAALRPLARRHVRLPAVTRTGSAALIGAGALVLERVDEGGGRVRIGGEEWSARAFLSGQEMAAGERVEVVQIDGATALVV